MRAIQLALHRLDTCEASSSGLQGISHEHWVVRALRLVDSDARECLMSGQTRPSSLASNMLHPTPGLEAPPQTESSDWGLPAVQVFELSTYGVNLCRATIVQIADKDALVATLTH